MKDLNFYADAIEKWLVCGDLSLEVSDFSEKFVFDSPFWEKAERSEFIDKFKKSSGYKDLSLKKIKSFDSVIKFKNKNQFLIVLNYYSINGMSVWEAVLGKVEDGKLSELRSIYDLNETKRALDLD